MNLEKSGGERITGRKEFALVEVENKFFSDVGIVSEGLENIWEVDSWHMFYASPSVSPSRVPASKMYYVQESSIVTVAGWL